MKKEHNNIKQYLNKGISTTAGILIVVLVAIVAGGIITWQMWPEQEAPSPSPTVSPASTTTPLPSPSPTPSPTPTEPYIKIISPNGGEKWEKGKVYDIKWDSNNIEKIAINIQPRDFGPIEGHIDISVDASQGSYSWKIPDDFLGSNVGDFKIYIMEVAKENIAMDESDNYFTITALDETADWKTYRNETFGFEVRHPENWRLLQEADIISFEPPFSDLYFNIDKISSQSTVKEFLEGIDSDAISLIEQKNIQVDGRTAIQRNTRYSRAPEGEDSWTTYIEDSIEQGYSITIIRLVGRPEVMNETIVSLYNQILSTFKFID